MGGKQRLTLVNGMVEITKKGGDMCPNEGSIPKSVLERAISRGPMCPKTTRPQFEPCVMGLGRGP